MNILILTRYGSRGASSRLRSIQYIPSLENANIQFVISPFFDDVSLARKYINGSYTILSVVRAYFRRTEVLIKCHNFDVVWIEKEALPWLPAWFESLLLGRMHYVLDFDDAIFHNYDLHRSSFVRQILGRRIDYMMSKASLVVAGNRYLAERAITAGANRVEILPTVVDVERYSPKSNYMVIDKPRIVWIGSPSTTQYLKDLVEVFIALAKRQSFTLRVIGGDVFTITGVDVESLPWSEDTEATLIKECDVGIMPLTDTPWERGKCAYKLIQYMACGLPTVASPVGANNDVVIEGETGFFADTSNAWIEKLERLLCDSVLRQRLGESGRARVEAEYSLQKNAAKLVAILSEVGLH